MKESDKNRPPYLRVRSALEELPHHTGRSLRKWVDSIIENGIGTALASEMESVPEGFRDDVASRLIQEGYGASVARVLHTAKFKDPYRICMNIIKKGDYETMSDILSHFSSYLSESEKLPFTHVEAERIYKALVERSAKIEKKTGEFGHDAETEAHDSLYNRLELVRLLINNAYPKR